jgi:hypothetical protein
MPTIKSRTQWFPTQKTEPWWQSIHPENGDKASANEPSDHGGKASTKKRASTLSAPKHLPERGLKSQWRQSIRQGSTDGQASVREERRPLRQSIHSGEWPRHSQQQSICQRGASNNNDDEASVNEESASGKATTPARSNAPGQTIAVEYKHTHAQLGTSPGARRTAGTTEPRRPNGEQATGHMIFFNDTFRKEVMPKGTPWTPSSLALEASKVGLSPGIRHVGAESRGSEATPPRRSMAPVASPSPAWQRPG